jgi:hypothetical protein
LFRSHLQLCPLGRRDIVRNYKNKKQNHDRYHDRKFNEGKAGGLFGKTKKGNGHEKSGKAEVRRPKLKSKNLQFSEE